LSLRQIGVNADELQRIFPLIARCPRRAAIIIAEGMKGSISRSAISILGLRNAGKRPAWQAAPDYAAKAKNPSDKGFSRM
jgi:hypothetical protein